MNFFLEDFFVAVNVREMHFTHKKCWCNLVVFFFYILIFESLKSKSSPFLLQFLFLKSNIKQFFFLFG